MFFFIHSWHLFGMVYVNWKLYRNLFICLVYLCVCILYICWRLFLWLFSKKYRNVCCYPCCQSMLLWKCDKIWAQTIPNNLKRFTWVVMKMSGKWKSMNSSKVMFKLWERILDFFAYKLNWNIKRCFSIEMFFFFFQRLTVSSSSMSSLHSWSA